MKTSLFSNVVLALAATALLSAAPRAYAVPVTFAGGSGFPLSFSLAAPVTYTITLATDPGEAPFFVFENVGNPFGNVIRSIVGNITFSINSGPSHTITFANSGRTLGVVTGNDLYFFGDFLPFDTGDVVTVTAGVWATSAPVAAAAPANGDFTTFIVDYTGTQISTTGVSGVPESLPTLWLALPLIGMVALRRRLLATE